MNFMSLFKRPVSTGPVARERLQILLAHERAAVGKSDLIAILQEEILAVITKHVPVESESIRVKMERGDAVSTLEVEVEIPTPIYVNLTFNAEKQPDMAPAGAPQIEASRPVEVAAGAEG
jgi:cell division topological specificity factor